MEFHETARVIEIRALLVPWNSMEFHGTAGVSEIATPQVPWNSMEFHGTARVIEIGALQVPWNSMEFHGTSRVIEIGTVQVLRNSMEFHGTARASEIGAIKFPWNSMEFHGTAGVIEIGALEVPWNSMEFHGTDRVNEIDALQVPWNCSCHPNWRTPSSMEFHAGVIEIGAPQVPWNFMEFHGTARVIEIGALEVPWNSMELLVSSKLTHFKFHGIPWNSMELLVSSKLAHSKFHGIPCNSSCHRNWRTPSSMEFHGIPWNCLCQRNWRTPSSMEFHGIPRNCSRQRNWHTPWRIPSKLAQFKLVSSKLAHLNFHGIPRNSMELLVSLAHSYWRTPSSMEFHGTAAVIEIGALQVPWNSMELLLSVPWNSMEPVVCYLMEPLISSIHWVLKWDRIPWNLSFPILMKIIFNCARWINFRKLINTLYLFAISFTNWCFIISICIIPYAFPALLITYQNIIQNLFSMLIETYFDQKVPWNFLQSSMELFEQHLNNTCGSMEFHGILSRTKVPWNSMELFWSSVEFHGIPWNLINFIFKKIIFLNIVFGIRLMIICYLAKISQKRYILHWFQYRNSYFEHPSVSENGTRSAKMARCYIYIYIYIYILIYILIYIYWYIPLQTNGTCR